MFIEGLPSVVVGARQHNRQAAHPRTLPAKARRGGAASTTIFAVASAIFEKRAGRGFGRAFIVAFVLLVAAPVPLARADLVGQFDAAVRNIRPWGGYTVVASTRVYETSGAPAPQLASAVVHFPRGAAVRRSFLTSRFFCDPAKLERDPNPALCANARFASGSLLIDARPAIADPIPADVSLFLAPGAENGATATVVALVKSNQRSPAYNYEVLRGFLIGERGGDRRFGYRLELPTLLRPLLPYVTLSLAEMKLKITGLTLERRTSPKRLFWLKTPDCPRRKKITFGADYAFQGAKPIFRRRKVSCARFLDLPTAHRKGRIPGAPG
jgi:hypothetical protein